MRQIYEVKVVTLTRGGLIANLKKLGMPDWKAYRNGNTRKGYWAVAGSGILTHTITNARLARRG